MFKNKKFEVKVVDDKPKVMPDVVLMDRKPRFNTEEIQLMKQAAKIIGIVWVTTVVVDAIARVAVANQENHHEE